MTYDANRIVATMAVHAFHAGFLTLDVNEDHATLKARVLGMQVRILSISLKKQSEAVAQARRASFEVVS